MRGKGTHIKPTKKRLSDNEIKALRFLTESTTSYTAKEIASNLNWDIRTTTSTLSNLAGLDLIKETPSESKIGNTSTATIITTQEPVYYVPLEPENLVRVRALHVMDVGGNLILLTNGRMRHEGLWPNRKLDRYDMSGEIKQTVEGKFYLSTWGVDTQLSLSQFVGYKLRVRIEII